MNKTEIILNVINQIRKNKQKPVLENIDSSMHLRNDLGLDSLDLAEFTVRIERETGIDVFEDGLVSTIADVILKIS
jgi:acyl carrier protein